MTEELDVGCSGIIVTPPGLPPGVQGGDGKRGSIVVNPDIHEPLFLEDVIDTIGNRLHDATLFDRIGLSEVIDIYLCVFTGAVHSFPAFFIFPLFSVFFASMDTMGKPWSWALRPCMLIWLNWASRSG